MSNLLGHIILTYQDYEDGFKEFYEEVVNKPQDYGDLALEYQLLENDGIPEVKKLLYWGFVYRYSLANLSIPEIVEYDGRRILINYDILTSYIIRKFCVVTFAKSIYYYDERRGVFRENNGILEKEIEKVLLRNGVGDKRKIRDTINEILARVQWRTSVDSYPFNELSSKLIPVRNGVIFRQNGRRFLLPHLPTFGFTYCLPVEYNPSAQCPKIEKFIEQVVPEDSRKILYEIPALCLLQNPRLLYAYMLVGSGSNGKSTYLTLLERFLGRENIASLSLQDLCEDKFRLAQLVGKLANIHADLPKNPVKYTGIFKMLTGGDVITAERKYRDPFEFVNKAVLIFSANELPKVNDNTYAFWRRWIIIEFPNRFERNPNFIDELTTDEELSGFLNKVLDAMDEIEQRGDVSKTDTVEKIKEEWLKKSNPVYAFVQECIEVKPGAYETKDDVYQAFVEFCNENDLESLPKNKFAQELQRLIPELKQAQKRIGKERVRVWENIRLKRTDEEVSEVESDFEEIEYDLTGVFSG